MEDLDSHVLAIQKIMATDVSSQDQVGSLSHGIKSIASVMGLDQRLDVQHFALYESMMQELGNRFCLIYIGQCECPK